MKRLTRNILILISPFMLMVLVNEVTRSKIKESPYKAFGITAINSSRLLTEKCTWACHNNTEYCKTHHVKYLKPYFIFTDFFYYGVIAALKSTGNYGAANIILLVLLIPGTILYFIIKSLNKQDDIRKLFK